MTPEQTARQQRRLEIEQQLFKLHTELGEITRSCKDHVIIKGRIIFSLRENKVVNTHAGLPDTWNGGSFSAYCAICDKNFGWWCPDSPTHYCEYDPTNFQGEWCKWCRNPEERK